MMRKLIRLRLRLRMSNFKYFKFLHHQPNLLMSAICISINRGFFLLDYRFVIIHIWLDILWNYLIESWSQWTFFSVEFNLNRKILHNISCDLRLYGLLGTFGMKLLCNLCNFFNFEFNWFFQSNVKNCNVTSHFQWICFCFLSNCNPLI